MVVGLAAILTSVLCTALVLGILPDEDRAIMRGRAKLCESIAVNSSVLVSRKDVRRLEAILQAIVERNDDVLSAAVRREDGRIVVEIGDHAIHWRDAEDDHSIDTQVTVPIRAGAQRWGGVEVRFEPVRARGVWGVLSSPATRLVLFVTSASYVLYFLYLGRMLQYLDPAKAVPGRVRSALDTLAEGLMVLDKQHRIVLANQAFALCVRRTPEHLLGMSAAALPWQDAPGNSASPDYPWIAVMQSGLSQEGVVMSLGMDDGEKKTFIVNCSPVHGQDGQNRGVLVSLEDVTLLEATKVELENSRDVAEKANAAKSEFLARMSHEIRTPMNAILGFTDVLMRGYAENETQRNDYLNTIHASGTHLLDLINDILDLSKIEAGRMEVERVACSPCELVSQVVSSLRIRAEEKGISCHLAAATDIPETIQTDPVRLRQVVTNLIGNAIKFTEMGGVRVVLRLTNCEERPQLAIDVVDSGVGVSRDAIQRIFNPFAQADSSVTRKYGGTGLGLSISQKLAAALGGGISVQSEPGEGSVFTATFDTGPLEGIPLVALDAVASHTGAMPKTSESVMQLPPARILLVDDGEANRQLIALVLHRAGAEVVSACDGKQAIELATSQHFDAILMDMQMPVMDGYTAASQLRAQGSTQPIMALTADAMEGSEARCREAGCSHFMTKPVNVELLMATLSELLSDPPAQKTAAQAAVATGASDARRSVDVSPFRNTAQTTQAANSRDAGSSASVRDRPSPPIVSSLPMDDPEFRQIVAGWVGRLGEQLAAMQDAHDRRDFSELAKLAHWLKGAGETVGFREFTGPATELLGLAREQKEEGIEDALNVLLAIAGRIEVPEEESVVQPA